jgi:hypothetical protein
VQPHAAQRQKILLRRRQTHPDFHALRALANPHPLQRNAGPAHNRERAFQRGQGCVCFYREAQAFLGR